MQDSISGELVNKTMHCINSGDPSSACAAAFRTLFDTTGCTDCFDELTLAAGRDAYCSARGLADCLVSDARAVPTCDTPLDQVGYFPASSTSDSSRRLRGVAALLSNQQSFGSPNDGLTGTRSFLANQFVQHGKVLSARLHLCHSDALIALRRQGSDSTCFHNCLRDTYPPSSAHRAGVHADSTLATLSIIYRHCSGGK